MNETMMYPSLLLDAVSMWIGSGSPVAGLVASLSGLILFFPLLHWITRHRNPDGKPVAGVRGSGFRHGAHRDMEELAVAHDALCEHVEHHASLNRIERAILEDTSLEDTVEVALSQLTEMIPCDRTLVMEFDAVANEAFVVSECGRDWIRRHSVRHSPGTAIGEADDRADDVYHPDLSSAKTPGPVELYLLKHGMRSCYRYPLTVQDRVAGILVVASGNLDGFSRDHHWVVRDIADLLSIAFRQHVHQIDRAWYETELIVARDRAEELARMKSAFLNVMTHELRTPLSGILGCAQILGEEVTDGQREFTGLIADSAKRLLSTINGVLDLSRLEAHGKTLALKRLDMASAAKDCVRLLEPLAMEKGLKLELEVDTGLDALLDESTFHRILNNLIGNAIKFTEEGRVSVRIDDRDDRIRLVVEDTGIGMDAAFLPHVFDEFRQESRFSKGRHEGSGLGLAITKRLVQKMNGTIRAESTKDHGTRMTVIFPAVQAQRPEVPGLDKGEVPNCARDEARSDFKSVA